jgi:hypothetical protein
MMRQNTNTLEEGGFEDLGFKKYGEPGESTYRQQHLSTVHCSKIITMRADDA